ncbi:MAG: DUF4214 domain-containing protein [Planctomycetes bacterium]|nr:DUF4214 domain-containing protein [Planctomycetota bacterium]
MRASVAAIAVLTAQVALAQEPPPAPVAPATVRVPWVGGNGHAETWDGRVFVITRNVGGGPVGWAVVVLRPEALGRTPEGRPAFDDACFSPEAALAMSPAVGHGLTDLNALALSPAPGRLDNPYRSEADGTPRRDGAFETYDLLVHTQRYRAGDDRLGVLPARVVVRDPRTPRAAVERAELLGAFQELRTTQGQPLRGIEPTVTFDGHLLVWQGHPRNDGQIDVLMYSFTQTPGAATGWSPPRSISDLYHRDRAALVAGLPLHERAPLAKRPLRAQDGRAFGPGELYRGAYPWISHDGTELFHTATVAGVDGRDRARRGGLSVIGRWTGWTLRHIDGPLNPDREASVRLFFSSPGAAPGFWRPFPDVPGAPLPCTAGRPVYPLFGSNTADYGEVSFEDHEDGDHVLVLRMNELVTKEATLDPTRTPDTSGRLNTGLLEGARFPQEYERVDENRGVVGQALYFPQGGAVRVRASASLGEVREALTLDLWVKRLVDLDRDGENRFVFLAHRAGAFDLILEEDGRVQATVVSGGAGRRSGPVDPALPVGAWAHVAVTYEAASGRLRVHVGGALRSEQVFGPGQVDATTADLLLGPAGLRPRAPSVGAGEAVVMLDEVKVSRVARRPDEVAASAFVATPGPDLTGRLPDPLPRGLDARDLRVPAGGFTREQAALGKLLFFDPRLSSDGAVSCASCHDPAKGYADGRARTPGRAGPLPLHTPALINRAFSTRQFWDGRSASLEAQALVPLEHPHEQALPVAQALDLLRASGDYRALFARAFGGDPTAERLEAALAAFQRSLVSGASRADLGALDPSEARGQVLFRTKARCTACHVGSNFTDEAFHDVGFTARRDEGRRAATGRAGDLGRFKTPTLRDVALTAPYLHDGSAGTLEEVVDLYDRGGVREEGRDPELRPLGLTPGEKADLVAFLRALTGTTLDVTPPASLPRGPGDAAPPAPGGTGIPGGATPPPPGPGPGPGPGPAVDPERRFVERLYHDVLGRPADPGGLDAHVQTLRRGSSRAEVARTFVCSTEHLERWVEGEYARLLRRSADPGGRDAAVRGLQAGARWEDLTAGLAASDEYRGAFPLVEPWVEQAYLDLLGRPADASGLATYAAALRRGASPVAVALTLLRSREHHERWVRLAHERFLGRPATQAEVRRHADALGRGAAWGEVWVEVLSTDEYLRR